MEGAGPGAGQEEAEGLMASHAASLTHSVAVEVDEQAGMLADSEYGVQVEAGQGGLEAAVSKLAKLLRLSDGET